MYIHNYQIHNVLNVYQRQLTQGTAGNKEKLNTKSQVASEFEYKRDRQTVIEKVASNILEKITLLEPNSGSNDEVETLEQPKEEQEKTTNSKNSKEFLFNRIDQNNQKIASSITVDSSNSLIYRFNELGKTGKQDNQHVNLNNPDKNIDVKV